MIKRLDNIKLSITAPESDLIAVAEKNLRAKVKYFKILKKSLDARDKKRPFYLYSIAFSSNCEEEATPPLERIKKPHSIVVVGAGPAGLFCALRLVERGFRPIIIERGEKVEERRTSCEKFFNERVLNTESNVQFGEGGAGAFSDGKLITRTKDGFNKEVLNLFVRFGAPEEVAYLNKPHIGSDRLYSVLQNIREYILARGGRYMFNTRLSRLVTDSGGLKAVVCKNTKDNSEEEIPVEACVVAVGHSARETFRMLNDGGVYMEPRDFAVGVRIEHLSQAISRAQYGEAAKLLPAADYSLVSHAHERTVFTFCMCPGGVVIPAASEEGGVVTNGMSCYARDGVNSNSALMVQLYRSDFGEGLWDGVEFLRRLERSAYSLGGSSYKAPVQLYGDFARGRQSQGFGEVKPTYAAGTTFAPLDKLLPKVAAEALRAAIPDMGKRLKGFDCADAILCGVESRFSSPVKMLRGAGCESVTLKNLYPCGEGSGYSGGITSSAADGIGVAEKLFARFSAEDTAQK